jgi:prepilin-type N-terminal cleavage/methylation domain-containing protein
MLYEWMQKEQSGMTLIESMIAMLILLVGLLSIAQVLTLSIIASKNYGRDAGKTTASARDKMEELSGLNFTDVRLTAGGSIDPRIRDGLCGLPRSGRQHHCSRAGRIHATMANHR